MLSVQLGSIKYPSARGIFGEHAGNTEHTWRGIFSARAVQTAALGDHGDGDGLFLRVQTGTDKLLRSSWVLRYTAPGGKRRRELGLGTADRISQEAAGASLKRARKKADEARTLLDQHVDPIDAKRARRAAEREKAAAERLTI